MRQGASDLHLTAGCPPVLRIDGDLVFVEGWQALRPEDIRSFVEAALNEEQLRRLAEERDLDLPLVVPGLARFRANAYHQQGCCALAIRVIPRAIPTIEELRLPPVVSSLALRARGLVLVTGPTGTGKSTTLAAMIGHINRHRRAHVVTIEDPIEYQHTHGRSIINQRELGVDVLSFAGGLRAALREDPDVIMVGEMRDLDTTITALTAAETGHLVLASMHTRDAASTVDRIIDQFPPYQQTQVRTMLAATLEAVIAQQLLPRTGGRGRTVAVEVMVATAAVRNLIREGKTHMIPNAISTGGRYGMQTMDQALRDLYHGGEVTYEDAVSRAFNPDELSRLIA
ncbi:MAG: type IV pilus twitching motility protein PilT [Bacillota bacterium]|nr:type IV pilus twitching motility protein PilT [Bacillota bacterium]